MSICSCLYPLHIIDTRDGGEHDPIDYLAIPQEVIDEMGGIIKIPKIKKVVEEDLDGVERDWVKVIWADSTGAFTKKYDVNDHIAVLGCDDVKRLKKCKIGGKGSHKCKLGCEEKEVYEVLHPIEEWYSHHIIEI